MIIKDVVKQELEVRCDFIVYHLRDENRLVGYEMSIGYDIPQNKFIISDQ